MRSFEDQKETQILNILTLIQKLIRKWHISPKFLHNESFKRNQQLIVTAIDFSKAFDSIKRGSLIEALKTYNIDPNVINTILNIYNDDNTDIFINNEKIANIKITSGIRQGCNGSTTLFKLVTFIIITELKKSGIGFQSGDHKIPALFFADDGLLLTKNKKETEELLGILHRV